MIVESAARRAEVALPSDVPIAGLVAGLVEMHEGAPAGGAWVLTATDGGVLPGNLTLEQCGAREGDVFGLRPMDGSGGAVHPPPAELAESSWGEAALARPVTDLDALPAEAAQPAPGEPPAEANSGAPAWAENPSLADPEPASVDSERADAAWAIPERTDAERVDAAPVPSDPAHVDPAHADPAHADPAHADPVATDPALAEPETPLTEVRPELPDAVPLPDRLLAVAGALVSTEAPVAAAEAPAASPDRLVIAKPRSAIERAQDVWRTSDYRHRLDHAIVAPRLARCVTIAVISPKGGVGKTTITVALATLLAMIRSDRVVAVDSNPDYGTLGRSISPDHPIFVDDLLQVLHQPALTVTMLERCLGRAQHGLMVLPAPTEPDRMEALDEEAYSRVVTRLQELAGIILLDCGPGMYDPATRAALKAADQLVVVSDAEPRTASLVAEAVLRLPGSTSYTFVVNRVPRSGSRLDIRHLEEDLHSARGLIRVEADQAAASRVAEGEFTWSGAPDSWQVAFRELAALLAADWERLGVSE